MLESVQLKSREDGFTHYAGTPASTTSRQNFTPVSRHQVRFDQPRRDVESAVKQLNYRVNGSEKFWTEAGAEEMLQLRADLLSSNEPWAAFWERRAANESGQHRYRIAA